MKNKPNIWEDWAKKIQHWGLSDFVATLLDATGPIHLLGAQMIYLGQPFLNQIFSDRHSNALANILEDPRKTQAFTAFLREVEN